MKKAILIFSLMFTLTLTGCNQNVNKPDDTTDKDDNPGEIPGDGENSGGSENPGGDDKPSETTNDGTLEQPYTISEAYDLIVSRDTDATSSETYYVKGKVKSITEISTSYGNGTFIVTDSKQDLTAFRLKNLGNQKFTSTDQLAVGDDVILCTSFQYYKLTTPKLYLGYVYSRNGKTAIDDTPGGDDKPSGGDTGDEDKPGTDVGGEIGGSDFGTYYSSITSTMTGGMNGTLRTTLTTLCKPKASISYSSGLAQNLQKFDEDPNNPNNMVYFYTKDSRPKNSASEWNREHVWPQSLSGGLYGKTGGGCDAHHIRPTYNSTNSARGNNKYADCPNGETLTYNNLVYGKRSGSYFEPLDSVKGDCARICLYMWVVYFAERNTPITNVASSVKTLVDWHKADPVDAGEILRNDRIASSVQKNRNPFIDHPEWVETIFG